MQTNDSSPADEAADYRAVSTLAVFGGLLGIVALLSCFLPWLSVVPWVGLVVSFVAARSILAEPGLRAGLPMALLGIALSASTLAGNWARAVCVSSHHRGSALPVAERFLEALSSGEPEFACELMRPWDERVSPDRAATFYRENTDAAERLAGLINQPAVAALQGGAELVGRPAVDTKRGQCFVLCLYAPEDASRAVAVTLSRSAASQPNAPAAWRVARIGWAKDRG